LTELRTGNGVIWRCEKCDGRAVGLQLLRRTFTPESINPLWLHAIHHEGRSARPCPSCGNGMFEVALDSSSGIKVEVCRIWEFVWFDAGETQTLRARPLPEPKPQVVLPREAREAIALAKVQQLAEQARGSDFDSAPPDEWWKSIAGFFGMPVEFDAPAKKRRPAVTWLLAGLIVTAWHFRRRKSAFCGVTFIIFAGFGCRHGLSSCSGFFSKSSALTNKRSELARFRPLRIWGGAAVGVLAWFFTRKSALLGA
jgi:Zn-finger nucleic acid-binding protein